MEGWGEKKLDERQAVGKPLGSLIEMRWACTPRSVVVGLGWAKLLSMITESQLEASYLISRGASELPANRVAVPENDDSELRSCSA